MIPICDLSRLETDATALAEFGATCREIGFFLLTGHGLEKGLLDGVLTQSHAFFAQPTSEKDKLAVSKSSSNRGYLRIGAEHLDDKNGGADQKEILNLGLELPADDPRVLAAEPFRAVNPWPELPGFRDDLLAYFDACLSVGVRLHRCIARDLDLDGDYFTSRLEDPIAVLRLLHYPASQGVEGEIGAGAHRDYCSITLLATDGVPGLQVKPRGSDTWLDVPYLPGAFVVNIGDCLMRWTNDLYQSTTHRVLAPKAERYSVAFFLHPNPNCLVSALPGTGEPKYPPVKQSDYLASRLAATRG